MLNVRKLLVMALIAPLAQAATPVTLYTKPTCGCCEDTSNTCRPTVLM